MCFHQQRQPSCQPTTRINCWMCEKRDLQAIPTPSFGDPPPDRQLSINELFLPNSAQIAKKSEQEKCRHCFKPLFWGGLLHSATWLKQSHIFQHRTERNTNVLNSVWTFGHKFRPYACPNTEHSFVIIWSRLLLQTLLNKKQLTFLGQAPHCLPHLTVSPQGTLTLHFLLADSSPACILTHVNRCPEIGSRGKELVHNFRRNNQIDSKPHFRPKPTSTIFCKPPLKKKPSKRL